MFKLYLEELLYNQSRLRKDGLCEDYVIIYDYLMEILAKDKLVGPLLVKKKQHVENINADIVLDFTKKYKLRSFLREPLLCLTLQPKSLFVNKNNIKSHQFSSANNKSHLLFNKSKTLIAKRITQAVWNALDNGFSEMGVFVRGHRDDIYELSLSEKQHYDQYIKVYAHSEDIDLKINLRILIQHTKNFQHEPKPFPDHTLKQDWLAMVPSCRNYEFDVCMPRLEKELRSKYILIIMLQRLLKHFFKQQQNLYILNDYFLESALYAEFLQFVYKKKEKFSVDYFFTGILIFIQHRFNAGNFQYIFNTKLNLLKMFNTKYNRAKVSLELTNIRHQTEEMRHNGKLPYEIFFNFFALKMEHDKYQVDQFGIFKSF